MTPTDFIVEATTVEEANQIDTTLYRLSERLSEARRSFIFLRRSGK